MTDWFRSWHGAPTDPKWLGIAKRAGVAPGIAVAVAWALMDRASQAEKRGAIDGYDPDGLACFFGCEPEQVEAIVAAMVDKGMIVDDRFTNWDKRQPKREDDSTKRVQAYRERQKEQVQRDATQRNAPETEAESDNPPVAPQGGGAGVLFEEVASVFPRSPHINEAKAERAFHRLAAEDQATLLAAARRYATWFEEERARRKRSLVEALAFAPPLDKWIGEGTWRSAGGLQLGEKTTIGEEILVVDASDPLVARLEVLRGKPYIVGNSGKISVRKSELERAGSAA